VTAQPPLIAAWLVGFVRTPQAKKGQAMRSDIYERITNQIISELEKGVRPWLKPWNVDHSAGRITRPLRGNGIPYQGASRGLKPSLPRPKRTFGTAATWPIIMSPATMCRYRRLKCLVISIGIDIPTQARPKGSLRILNFGYNRAKGIGHRVRCRGVLDAGPMHLQNAEVATGPRWRRNGNQAG
jgi:hypothetical protein